MLALVAQVEPDQRSTLSIDLGADPLTASLSDRPAPAIEDVVAVASRVAGDQRGAGDHGRRARVPQSGRQRDLGARRQRRGRGGLPSGAHRVWDAGRAGASANQFPAGRRRRSVHDDRQDASRAATMGAGRRGRRRPGRRRSRGARGDFAADDDPARPVGEHAALHAGRLRCGRRRCRHGAGVPVRRGDPGRLSRHGDQLRAPDRSQHPAAALGRVTRRPGVGPGRRVLVRRGPHRTAGAAGLASISRRSRRRGGFVDARDYRRRPDRRHRRTARRRHRASAHRDHRRQRVSEPGRTGAAAGRFVDSTTRGREIARYAAAFEALRDRSDVYLARTGSRPQALLLPLGPLAEHNIRDDVRGEPAGLGWHRGDQPGNGRRRRRWPAAVAESPPRTRRAWR